MKIAADANVLLRAVVGDDERQGALAIEALESAEMVVVSLQTLCEFAWVLSRRYGVAPADVSAAIRGLMETQNVVVNRPAVDLGLSVLEAGGDFADGVIAYDGAFLGADTFVSFDRRAVALLTAKGRAAKLLT